VYGSSVENRPLLAYRFGSGPIARALIGGLHGGYEWNTTALLSKTLEHLAADPNLIPPDLTLYVIPLVNPDGAAAGADRVEGRMNANGVDLNRNWDYEWQPAATHGSWPVSAGSRPFSEPETAALRDFILDREIEAAVFYHSAAAVVYSGAGEDASETVALARLIAAATGYRYAPEGVPGQITTGNAIDWLSGQGIAAVEVELSTHEALDWQQNLHGILAFLNWNLRNTGDD
jgi:g-D-glutamyl-meso-diaminopimelate peptidase